MLIHKKNISDISKVKKMINKRYKQDVHLFTLNYSGRAKNLEKYRIDINDFKQLNQEDREKLTKLKTEKQWIKDYEKSVNKPYDKIPNIIKLRLANIDDKIIVRDSNFNYQYELSTENNSIQVMEDLFNDWQIKYSKWVNQFPPLKELTKSGNNESLKLYKSSSIIKKWSNIYLKNRKK